jgi:phosphoribosylglycinamide formyltransferase 1
VRLAVLISGSGTTLQNLLDRTRDGRLAAEVVGVVSSRVGVRGVQRATAAGVPVRVVERKPADTFPARVWDAVGEFRPDLICLAGWLHLLPIRPEYRGRVLNIHPSLLPAFGGKGMYGRHVHEAVIASGAAVSGCTVHHADEEYDTGPILVQKQVPVLPGDTPESLAARVFAAECEAYPEAIRRFLPKTATVPAASPSSSGPTN